MKTIKMDLSKKYFERAVQVTPGGVHSPVRAFKSVGGQPVFFAKAEGAFLETVDGDRLIDFCQSFGPHLLGHRDPEISEVVHETVDMAWSLGACEPYSLELAEWITGRLPWVEKIRFTTSGTEAVMSALRVARAATGRNKIVKFNGCYHGHVDVLLVKAGSGLAGASAADSAGLDPLAVSQTLVVDIDDESALDLLFAQQGSEIAAVIIEPLPANYGLLEQREEYIRHVMQVARQHGALVIFDEVISGFRVAQGGMAERLKLKPDLVTYGKVIGGGFPVGAYGGRKDLLDLVAPSGPVYQAGTLSASPVGMRAGLAVLKKAERVNLYSVLEQRTQNWVRQINQACQDHDWPMQVASVASIFWFHQRSEKPVRNLRDLPATQSESFRHLFHKCLDRGVYLAPSGFEVGFISLAHTEAVLDEAKKIILEAMKEIYG